MKRFILSLVLLVTSAATFADTYQVTYGWVDPTPAQPGYVPVYEAKYRIAGGSETVVPGLTVPGGSLILTASPGQTIEVAAQARNGDLVSGWTPWATATAAHAPVQPAGQTGLTITVVRTGP